MVRGNRNRTTCVVPAAAVIEQVMAETRLKTLRRFPV